PARRAAPFRPMRRAHQTPGGRGAGRQQSNERKAQQEALLVPSPCQEGCMGGGSASHGFSRRNDARADSSQAGIGVKWADPTPVPGASGPTGTAAHRQSGQVQDVLPGAESADARAGATLASMLRLLETFFRHRLLLLGPVALVIAGSIGWVVIRPPADASSVTRLGERPS